MQKNARKNMLFSAIRKVNAENTMIINNLFGENWILSWFLLRTVGFACKRNKKQLY